MKTKVFLIFCMKTHEEKALGLAVPHKDLYARKNLAELLQREKRWSINDARKQAMIL